jgi:hypothetical protein
MSLTLIVASLVVVVVLLVAMVGRLIDRSAE